ncbi:MAG: SDR family NAD(P)-dependent oxidoreductase [Acidimicrobiia bacterium]
MPDLTGKVAIVTGAGRPRGIGRAAAIALARAGANVVVTDLAAPGPKVAGLATVAEDASGLQDAVVEIESLGRKGFPISCDITDEQSVHELVDAAVAEFGRIDVLFNNAGTPVGVKPFLQLSNDDWATSWEVNVMGIVFMCRAVIPVMQRNGGGSIINNSSASGLRALPDYSAYTATKHAVIGLSKTLALEYGRDGIRVNAICPGDIDTDMTDVGMALAVEFMGVDPKAQESLAPLDAIALGRRGTADEIGRVVTWLASDEASYVTGSAQLIDGGLLEGM